MGIRKMTPWEKKMASKEKKVASTKVASSKVEPAKEKKVKASELLQKDEAILEEIAVLSQKLDTMDRNNKKFLMTATMKDKDTEKLESDLYHTKMGVLALLDQIDYMLEAVASNETGELAKGLSAFQHKITEITAGMGIEEIPATEKMKFNSKEHECTHTQQLEDYEDEVIVELLQKGYRDRSGKILRCAKVSVNKIIQNQDDVE